MAGGGVIAAKLAATLLTNDKTRKGIGWIIAAILSPLILIIAVICVLLSGGAEHNNKAIDLSFNGGYISLTTPTEYRNAIENMQRSFSIIDDLVEEVNRDTEYLSLDLTRVKAIFYAFFYSETNLSSLNHSDFVQCFYYTEQRTKTETAIDEYGNEYSYEVTYTVNIPHSDLLVVYGNLSKTFGKEVKSEDMIKANEIYNRQMYGNESEYIEDVTYIKIDGFIEPVSDWQSSVSSEYGNRYHPITGEYSMHYGIDLAKSEGTPIHSVLDGIVTYVGYDADGYGKYIKVSHQGGYETIYAHCNTVLVENGQKVEVGEIIASVGTTGSSTGNHLHFEIIVDGERVNPRIYLPR